MKKQATFIVIAAAAAALLAAPAFAQQGGGMKTMPMKEMKSSSAPKKMKGMHSAKMKRSCMDYAWGSQDAKDCEAGKIKPPSGR